MSGYAMPSKQLRRSLLIEFRKARSQLNAQIRSTYADGNRHVPPGRMRQLEKQLGPVDPRFEAAGFVSPDNIILSALRAGRDPTEIKSRSISTRADCSPDNLQEQFFTMALQLNSGMLAQDDEYKTDVERVISSASDDRYKQARAIFENMRDAVYSFSQGNDEGTKAAFETTSIAFQQREFLVFLLVEALRSAVR